MPGTLLHWCIDRRANTPSTYGDHDLQCMCIALHVANLPLLVELWWWPVAIAAGHTIDVGTSRGGYDFIQLG